MRSKVKATSMIELLVIMAIIALLMSILLPSLSRARELSKRLVCQANVKGIGTACKIFAADNHEQWPVPLFKKSAINMEGIDYLAPEIDNPNLPVCVGFERRYPSGGDGPTGSGAAALTTTPSSTALSVTRCFWMLVRSGDVAVKQFICPSSQDIVDPTQDIDFYYDFTAYRHESYAYQVPWGPATTRARGGMDIRHVVAADKGPFYLDGAAPDWTNGGRLPDPGVLLSHPPQEWRPFNSPNHGGEKNGEGQNCLYFDGHVEFNKTPVVGIDGDNIYTLMYASNDAYDIGRIHGEVAHNATTSFGEPYPGCQALGNGPNDYSTTDSLLYP